MASWLMRNVLRNHSSATLLEWCCVLVLTVGLWRSLLALVMQAYFGDVGGIEGTAGMGSIILTLSIFGSTLGMLAHVVCW
jgi:hypothetical protein